MAWKLPKACVSALQTALAPALFRALGDESRMWVLARLAGSNRPMTVTEVAEGSTVHLSGVSRHLAQLRDEGIAISERDGREVRYRMDSKALAGALRALADALDDCCSAGGCCGLPAEPQG